VWRFAPGEPPTRLRKIGLGTQEFRQSRLIPSKQQPYKFSEFSVLSVDRKRFLRNHLLLVLSEMTVRDVFLQFFVHGVIVL
jgi:hypothetical protein